MRLVPGRSTARRLKEEGGAACCRAQEIRVTDPEYKRAKKPALKLQRATGIRIQSPLITVVNAGFSCYPLQSKNGFIVANDCFRMQRWENSIPHLISDSGKIRASIQSSSDLSTESLVHQLRSPHPLASACQLWTCRCQSYQGSSVSKPLSSGLSCDSDKR